MSNTFLNPDKCAEQFRFYAESHPSADSQHSLRFCADFLNEFCPVKNFSIGYRHPRTKSNQGVVYLNGEAFANTFQQDGSWFKDGLPRWIINIDGKAAELKFEHDEKSKVGFDTADELLEYLESWYLKAGKPIKPV